MKIKKTLCAMSYAVFTLAIFLIMTLVMFPFDSLEHRLEFMAQEKHKIDLNLTELDFDWPLGIKYDSLKVSSPYFCSSPIKFKQGKIELDFLNLILGKYVSNFKTRLDQGMLKGCLNLTSLFPPQEYDLKLQWENIFFRPSPTLMSQYNLSSLKIKTKGQLHSQGNYVKSLLSKGSGNFTSTDTDLTLRLNLLPSDISLKSIKGTCHWELDQGILKLKKSSFQAKGLQGHFKGRLSSLQTRSKIKMDLKGTIAFSSSLSNLYSLIKQTVGHTHFQWSIRGKASQPSFSFSPI
ncbi:MAG TPA: type II secretion system protein GspN [Desulfohalobiaceae bacterium]|nr:type II secretion system protein GspN [Desulfohalobiaceae bacterium]